MLSKAIFEELGEIIVNDFDDISLQQYADMDEQKAVASGHHSLGRYIRNQWGLWTDNALVTWFNNLGIFHADDMSGIIMTSYHRYLNDQDIDLDVQVEQHKAYWAKMGCDMRGREIKHTNICECECHIDGTQIMHCMACCELTYNKYISEDGEIDMIRWAKLYKERNK